LSTLCSAVKSRTEMTVITTVRYRGAISLGIESAPLSEDEDQWPDLQNILRLS